MAKLNYIKHEKVSLLNHSEVLKTILLNAYKNSGA